jgi:hypothetical protein
MFCSIGAEIRLVVSDQPSMAHYLLVFAKKDVPHRGTTADNFLDTHYCRLQESRAEANSAAMKF